MQQYSLSERTDEMLLDLIRREDDREAFSELYLRYWRILNNTAFKRLKSVEAAEEAVQDIFLDIFLKRFEIDITSSVEGYLKTALKYKIFKIYRSQQMHIAHVDRIIRSYDVPADLPDVQLDHKLLREEIYRAANQMPEKCREVFLMSRFEQQSHQSIAIQLGISVSTVKKHITKAMRILRKELSDHRFGVLAFCLITFSKR